MCEGGGRHASGLGCHRASEGLPCFPARLHPLLPAVCPSWDLSLLRVSWWLAVRPHQGSTCWQKALVLITFNGFIYCWHALPVLSQGAALGGVCTTVCGGFGCSATKWCIDRRGGVLFLTSCPRATCVCTRALGRYCAAPLHLAQALAPLLTEHQLVRMVPEFATPFGVSCSVAAWLAITGSTDHFLFEWAGMRQWAAFHPCVHIIVVSCMHNMRWSYFPC